jgi:putative serine/threonine protein kinase
MQRFESAFVPKTCTPPATVQVSKLRRLKHGQVLCYPGTNLETFDERIKELWKIGITEIIFEGSSKVGNLGVIGKGCVSIVIKARLRKSDEIIALKCRRADANRDSMKKDFELQKFANSFGVGPRAVSASDDFFAMEYVDAVKVGKWLEKLKTRSSKKFLRKVIRDTLTQCFLLDRHGLDHGELSNPAKHILIRRDKSGNLIPKVVIIDYESASTSRKVSNLTSVAQFFFLSGWRSGKIRKILGVPRGNSRLISFLKKYKEEPTNENFERLMIHVRC